MNLALSFVMVIAAALILLITCQINVRGVSFYKFAWPMSFLFVICIDAAVYFLLRSIFG